MGASCAGATSRGSGPPTGAAWFAAEPRQPRLCLKPGGAPLPLQICLLGVGGRPSRHPQGGEGAPAGRCRGGGTRPGVQPCGGDGQGAPARLWSLAMLRAPGWAGRPSCVSSPPLPRAAAIAAALPTPCPGVPAAPACFPPPLTPPRQHTHTHTHNNAHHPTTHPASHSLQEMMSSRRGSGCQQILLGLALTLLLEAPQASARMPGCWARHSCRRRPASTCLCRCLVPFPAGW